MSQDIVKTVHSLTTVPKSSNWEHKSTLRP